MTTNSGHIPWTDWGGDGPLLHLAHANGFPPGAYARLVQSLLPRFHVVSMAQRPLWPDSDPRSLRDWDQLGRDLRDCLREKGHDGIIGVGHSVGGASTLIAAAMDPELFRGVVLLDPTILGGPRAFFWSIAKAFRQVHRVFVVRDALNRRDRWESREEVRESWAAKQVFVRLDPRCLDDYVQCGVVDHPDGGVTLRYSKEWEARVFATTPSRSWGWIRRLVTPCLVVRGSRSDTLLPGVAARLDRLAPTARLMELEGSGHLFPLEAPERTAGLISDFIDSLPPA